MSGAAAYRNDPSVGPPICWSYPSRSRSLTPSCRFAYDFFARNLVFYLSWFTMSSLNENGPLSIDEARIQITGSRKRNLGAAC